MSHFRVLNIGNVEENMQPYNEQDEELFQHVNRTEEFKEDYKKYNEDGKTIEEFFQDWNGSETIYVKENVSEVNEKDIPQNPYCVAKRNEDGSEELLAGYSWYNPNAKYDYYTPYSEEEIKDLLILKGTADNDFLTVKDIDWRGMLEASKEERRKDYKHIVEVLGHAPAHKPFSEFEKEYKDFEEAKKAYSEQEDVEAFFEKEAPFWVEFYILDEYLCGEDEYAEKTTLPFFAMNIDGEWVEKGKMGWWAIVIDKKNSKEWSENCKEIVDRLSKEEYLQDLSVTVLDCHI